MATADIDLGAYKLGWNDGDEFVYRPRKGISPEINALNTVWVLLAAFLVFCMQVGFVMLEAGFARSRETVNILVEGIADTCICGITFWLWGFAFMFGNGNGVPDGRLARYGRITHLTRRRAGTAVGQYRRQGAGRCQFPINGKSAARRGP